MFIVLAQQRSHYDNLIDSHVFLVPQNLKFVYDQLDTDIFFAVVLPERTLCEQGSENDWWLLHDSFNNSIVLARGQVDDLLQPVHLVLVNSFDSANQSDICDSLSDDDFLSIF